ncbi:hypothetical protein FRC12_007380 [Ceratobasidium sp. 428]|nr:hypothetical protein FRC12_007380 [Ceratobasidium sp. 428]
MDMKCKALDNWKACRSALATAIRSYLAACDDLRLACSQIQRPFGTRQKSEQVLLAIDVELAELAYEEAALSKTRLSLSVLRNTSLALTPVHSLPPEILSHIFLMAQYSVSRAGYTYDLVPSHNFAGVSSYWRATAINSPRLWTHINITHGQNSYEFATLLLHRSNGLPICLDISSETNEQQGDYRPKPQWEKFLASVSRQVYTLNIVDQLPSPETLLHTTINLLLRHGSPGVIKSLCIQRPEPEQPGNLSSLFAGQSDAVLQSVSLLHLGDAMIPWTSVAYHNLVDLRLRFDDPEEADVSTSQFANILAASPGLVILKLEGMAIEPSNDWEVEMDIQPVHLEVLYLAYLSYDSYVTLPSILSLSNCPGTLEVGIHHHADFLLEISQIVQDFLRGVRVKTLSLSSFEGEHSPQWALSLPATIPSLDNLILNNCDTSGLHGPEETVYEPEIKINITPRLPHLFLVSNDFDIDKLKLVVSVCGVETLHLQVQNQYMLFTSRPAKDELKAALLESFPNLTCTISDEDTTLHWPCRTMFD